MNPEAERGPESEEQSDRRLQRFRKLDSIFARALLGVIAFLFCVNVVFGTYVFVTTRRVDHQNQAIRLFVCTQNNAYKQALTRERDLQKHATPQTRATHKQSADAISEYLKKINGLVDCHGIRFK